MLYPSLSKRLLACTTQVFARRGIRGRKVQRIQSLVQSPVTMLEQSSEQPALFSAFQSLLNKRKLEETKPSYTSQLPHKGTVEDILSDDVTHKNMHELVARSMTPLANLRYSEQLLEKEKRAQNVLRELMPHMKEVPAKHKHMVCSLEPIVSSPVLTRYRNKDEFVVGRGLDGNPKTVGFLTGRAVLEDTVCVPPTRLIHIKDDHKAVATHFEQFIRTNIHETCIHFTNSPGVWRSITVRSNEQDELMLLVVIHPHTLREAEKTSIEADLVSYFINGPGSDLNIRSLYLQVCPNSYCSRGKAPFRLLHGDPFITDRCQSIEVSLAPDTFFPINVAAAELLYDTLKEVAGVSAKTTLLNVSSGHSTTALLLSRSVRGSVGIETSQAAIDEAEASAKNNGVSNCQYVCGSPELVLPRLQPTLAGCGDLLALVHTGGGGLAPAVVQALRQTPSIRRLLLLTKKPKAGWMSTVAHLGDRAVQRGKHAPSAPLLPHKAFVVDSGPHTDTMDLGLLLLREER